MSIEAFLAGIGLNKVSVITGALGAALAAAQGSSRSVVTRVLNFIGGFCCAAWGTGAAVDYFQIADGSAAIYGALGFALGYFGMTLVDALQVALGALRDLDWKDIATSWFRKKD